MNESVNQNTLGSSVAARLKALQDRHSQIAARLQEERRHASSADFYLNQIKKLKLRIKDEIEILKSKESANSAA